MDDIKKRIEAAYAWLNRLAVTGESVDYLAVARQELRAAYELLCKGSEQSA